MSMPLPAWLTAAFVPRLTLLLNHVMASESSATARLRPHAGRKLRLDCAGPPGWPALPPLVFEITPAGLFEAASAETASDLRVVLDASQALPFVLNTMQGQKPRIEVSGDAALAADVSWLFDHLRWDIEDDLAPWLGPVVAKELVRWGKWLALGLREAALRLSGLVSPAVAGGPPSV